MGVTPKMLFEVTSSPGKRVRVTEEYWQKIVTTKHPVMVGCEDLVKGTLENPELVRRSRKDRSVLLYYGSVQKRYCCVVVRHLNGDGFIVTAYITDRIKIGDAI